MKFLYYLACVGVPNVQEKKDLIINNITKIYNQIQEKIDIVINCYDDSLDDLSFLDLCEGINKYFIYKKKGILAEVWLTNPYNEIVKNYDYVFFILDDVKLNEFDINEMIRIKNNYNIEMLSPRVTNCYHTFMHTFSGLTINNFVELFCLLLTPKDFYKFSSIHTVENKWMWGPDLLFGFYKIRAGVYNNCIANHENFQSKSISFVRPWESVNNYLKEKTTFTDWTQLFQTYNPVIEQIN
jgi:hypothetical protein